MVEPMRLTNGTGMISAGAAASTASARNIGKIPAAAPSGTACDARSAPALERRRPVRRLQRARGGVEPPQHAGARPLRLEQEDVLDQARRQPPTPAPCASCVAIARSGLEADSVRLAVERHVDAGELAVELLREVGGARLQAGAHARAFSLADFAEPAVLQHRERDEQHGEHDAGDQLPRRRRTVVEFDPHEHHCTRNAAANRRALHLLQNDCPEITTSAAARRHTFQRGDDVQRMIVYLMSLAMTAGGFAARAAGDAKAEQLMAQARAALGGEKNLSKVQGLTATGTYQRTMADRQVGGEVTIDLQLPDKLLRTESMSPMGDILIVTGQGLNGDRLLRNQRTLNGPPGVMIRTPSAPTGDAEVQAVRNARADLARTALAFLLASPASLPLEFSAGGEAESDEGKADVIDAKGAGNFAARILLDQKTHRPLMLIYRGVAPRMVIQTQQGPPPDGGRAAATTPHDVPDAPAAAGRRHHALPRRLQGGRRRDAAASHGALDRRQADRGDDVQDDQAEPRVQGRHLRGQVVGRWQVVVMQDAHETLSVLVTLIVPAAACGATACRRDAARHRRRSERRGDRRRPSQ